MRKQRIYHPASEVSRLGSFGCGTPAAECCPMAHSLPEKVAFSSPLIFELPL